MTVSESSGVNTTLKPDANLSAGRRLASHDIAAERTAVTTWMNSDLARGHFDA